MAQLTPTKGNLIALKRSRELAKNGFELMDKKRNVLIREIMSLLDKAEELQSKIGSTFSDAYISMRLANITLGGCEHIAEAVPLDDTLSLRYRSVMGVEIPMVVNSDDYFDGRIPYGFTGTNYALDEAFERFMSIKVLLNDLAKTENAIIRLAYAIKKTQKRANALQNIVIPGLDGDIARISESLEEKEREEFVRMKVIKARRNAGAG